MTFQQYFSTLSAEWQKYLNENPSVKLLLEHSFNTGKNSVTQKVRRPD
jgi:hypothetical protein